jgi:GT2 family glycosyltransferase
MTAIYCVTVTYGNRKSLLEKTIADSFKAGIEKAIVINNGAAWDVAGDFSNAPMGKVVVIDIGHNSGSASGFRRGIEAALILGAEYILLLDDDTAPYPGTVSRLLSSLQSLGGNYGFDNTIVAGYREVAMQRIIRSEGPAYALNANPPLLRFSPWLALLQFARSLSRVINPSATATAPTLFPAPFAPFGGLLIHRSAVAKIGLPDERFVLYCDDFEWTHRLVARGGIIRIDTEAPLREIDISYQFRKKSLTRFHSLVLRDGGPSDYRVYYEVRNSVYFATHAGHSRNRRIVWRIRFLCLVTGIISLIYSRGARFKVILRAVTDGLAGNLGPNGEFPLEQSESPGDAIGK